MLQNENLGQRSLKVIETSTIQHPAYGFLLAFCSNSVSKIYHFLRYLTLKALQPWNLS